MIPTAVRASKASRAPLTPKRGNKDYYKGTRQAFLPGSRRTGAPGKHVIGGKAKYRLIDEKVRVFVAPPIHNILSSQLHPYVHVGVKLSDHQKRAVFGRVKGSLSPESFLQLAREHSFARNRNLTNVPPVGTKGVPYNTATLPPWLRSQMVLNGLPDPLVKVKRTMERPEREAEDENVNDGKKNLQVVMDHGKVTDSPRLEAPGASSSSS